MFNSLNQFGVLHEEVLQGVAILSSLRAAPRVDKTYRATARRRRAASAVSNESSGSKIKRRPPDTRAPPRFDSDFATRCRCASGPPSPGELPPEDVPALRSPERSAHMRGAGER